MRVLLGAAAAAMTLLVSGTASATTVVDGKCASLSAGCLFNGNINSAENGNNSYHEAEAAFNIYNNAHPSAGTDITLSVLFASDDPGFPGTLVGGGGSSGTWSLPGYSVNYLAVMTASQFVLYAIPPASSGNWSTADIPYKNNPHDLSHLVFFGSKSTGPVPEPASWALMLLGFGGIGGTLRSRRQSVVSFG